jgi:hypothetical protein
MFQKVLLFHSAIVICCSKHIIVKVICRVLPLLTWQICQIIVNCLFPIVLACVLNELDGHWLLGDALHFTISMNLRLKEENQIVLSIETLMDDDSIIVDELVLVAFNIRREVCDVLDSSLLFLTK